MGNSIVKPAPGPNDTQAAVNAEMAQKVMHGSAENFFKDVRMGEPTLNSLGYKLAGMKLTDQEYQVICHTSQNVTSDDIKTAVDSLFSKDWKSVVDAAVNEIVMFLNGAPTDNADIQEWSKSYLLWENASLVQYSVYILKTSSTSMGTVAASTYLTKLACICRGLVAYEAMHPQTIVYELRKSHPNMTNPQFTDFMKSISDELKLAAGLTQTMLMLTSPAARIAAGGDDSGSGGGDAHGGNSSGGGKNGGGN
ncbi:hypothetical protein Vafri_10530 [Volvox africanus]|uniref:Uncharacterized protein n=1 Tax=Volvox africanus TaxID=51714 RepID=A0A8J4EZP8_9CHLO|nr:hypothetical protein Vafri_10530 [Volvox africanus]